MPRTPVFLAMAGLVPFVGGAWMVHFGEGGWLGIARFSMPIYAAVILSFLGGTQWGFALAPGARQDARAVRLLIAMVPSIAGWLIMALPFTAPQNKYLMFAGLLILWAAIDHVYARRGWAPDWYPKLRWPITIIAAGSMVIGSTY
ncbi:DUF3429 domain-containing protein [Minwuia sp.]|uniref:DUF3429 domain-containing protein n=1 Tax=Minwuia sp. TaxID=2493630 RepID=UPI003A94D443